jgi:hypothetical protein
MHKAKRSVVISFLIAKPPIGDSFREIIKVAIKDENAGSRIGLHWKLK